MPRPKKVDSVLPTIYNTLDPKEIIQPDEEDITKYDVKVITAEEVLEERRKRIKYLITGTPLDELTRIDSLGFETSAVYEIYGANGTGKTQTCNTLSVLTEGDVIWIDGGEDTFRPQRIMEIAKLRGKNPEETIKRIHVVNAYNAFHLEAIVAKLPSIFLRIDKESTDKFPFKWVKSNIVTDKGVTLVVLDSLAPTFTLQYQGIDQLGPRQRAILRVIMYLRLLSVWFNCVVIVTNQIRDSPGSGGAFLPAWVSQKPVGGPTVSHNIDFQIMLRKGKQNISIARVMDSSNTPMGEKEFVITAKGIEDISVLQESLK